MIVRRYLLAGFGMTAAAAAFLVFQAFGQDPVDPGFRLETRLVDETIERKLPDGRVERVTVQVPVTERVETRSSDLYAPPSGNVPPLDTQAVKLIQQEQTLAQEAYALGRQARQGASDAEREEAKKKLREKLAEIFDLQQQRRTREIAKIEERLGKLKDVLKKRDTAKDSIIDRRLESLTGGVDELGWEESLAPSAYQGPAFGLPTLQPRLAPGTQPGADPEPGVGGFGPAVLPPTIPGPNAVIPPVAGPSLPPAGIPSAVPTAPAPAPEAPGTTPRVGN